MRTVFFITLLFEPCTFLFATTNDLSFVPAAEFSLADTTNGLESSFEYYFAAATVSNDVQSGVSGNAFIKCPIIMCQPICMVADNAYVALADETQTDLNPPSLGSGGEITFKRPIGPFHSATNKMFTPPIALLNHNFFEGGQIESIVATSIVWHATFELCKAELMNAKKAFERYGIEFDIMEDEVVGKCEFKTRIPTWGGWMVSLSVCRMTKWEFASIMILSRKRPEKKADYASLVPVDVDI